MKSTKGYRWILIAGLLISACAWGGAGRYVGQALEPEDRHPIDAASGSHVITTNTFTLQESYRLDRAANQITLTGRIQYTFDEDTHRVGAIVNRLWTESIYIQALFADAAGEVIAVESIRRYPETPLFYPVSFEQTLPLPPGSAFLTFRLTSYLRDGGTRMISRQVSATETEETGGVDHGGGGLGWMSRQGAAEFSIDAAE